MMVYHESFSQAQHIDRYRDMINEHYQHLRRNVTGVLRTGIEQGVFRDVDVEDMLRLITDVIYAARARKIALGYDDAPKQVQRAINEFVFSSFALLPTTPTSIAPSTV